MTTLAVPALPARIGWRARTDRAANWLLVAACAALPLPQAFESITSVLFMLAFVLAGGFAERWARLRTDPRAQRALLLFGLMLVSVLWSTADRRPAIDGWWHYRGLMVLAFGLLSIDDPAWCRRGFIAFIAAFVFALVVSYLRWFGVLNLYNNGGKYAGFVGHTGFSLMLAIVAFVAFGEALRRRHDLGRIDAGVAGWAGLGLASVINLYFVNDGRTGQVLLLVLLPWVLARRMKLRGLVIGTVAAVLLIGAAYLTAPTFRSRTYAIVASLQNAREGNQEELTAEGLRLSFYRHSLELIRAHPVLGDGAGSFGVDYLAVGARNDLQGQFVTRNPHNDFLMIAAQQGLVGLALLIWLWVAQWRRASSDGIAGVYAQATLISCIVAALFSSILLDAFESHLYALLSVVFSRSWSRR